MYGTFDPRTVEGWTEVDLPYGELILKARKLYKTKDLSEDVIHRLTDHGMVWIMTKFKTQIYSVWRYTRPEELSSTQCCGVSLDTRDVGFAIRTASV